MIAHIVLFKFKRGIQKSDPRVVRIVAGMEGLPAKIDLIRGWEHGFNVTADALAWDYVLRATFDTVADMHAYFSHPDHAVVLGQWEEVSDYAYCDLPLP